MGSNGAGKSTFLNTLMGFLSPKEGTIDFNEEKISLRNPMASIGFSSQKMVMDWYLNVWDNVYLGCSLAGMGGNRAKVLTEKALQRVSLTEKAKKGVDELSGGQQQRVQIGRAIVHEPDLYILQQAIIYRKRKCTILGWPTRVFTNPSSSCFISWHRQGC